MMQGINSFPVAAIQMVSSASVEANLNRAQQLVEQAVSHGARLVALPEYFCFMGHRDHDKLGIQEEPGAGRIQNF